MHKLRLHLDDLAVDSLDMGAEADRPGTVRANQEPGSEDSECVEPPVSLDSQCHSNCNTQCFSFCLTCFTCYQYDPEGCA